jgi:hypothetical protein
VVGDNDSFDLGVSLILVPVELVSQVERGDISTRERRLDSRELELMRFPEIESNQLKSSSSLWLSSIESPHQVFSFSSQQLNDNRHDEKDKERNKSSPGLNSRPPPPPYRGGGGGPLSPYRPGPLEPLSSLP